ncbi:hypothetical protein AS189_19135 (plasmid) [Arthrobacter alpinus]|uniref:Uncharacterized protein n=1 Tax=Arthrobacter alpinus TaxID=656366 RepID=A0A0S2M550_9MICC|nr:hypothetical protein AS189_19135 [Arthrobacter alpinus]
MWANSFWKHKCTNTLAGHSRLASSALAKDRHSLLSHRVRDGLERVDAAVGEVQESRPGYVAVITDSKNG